jgi:hypothetical protein
MLHDIWPYDIFYISHTASHPNHCVYKPVSDLNKLVFNWTQVYQLH